jgi:acetate kinase
VITLQLGAGCSVTASRRGQPVETSMGFSPLEGLMMATRCGDLDPTVVLHLLQHGGLDAEAIDTVLNHQSGLLGVSGLSGDMETVLASDAPEAALAVAMFCHRARKYVGAYLAVLGGADAILFGGGIGEHAPAVRAGIVAGLEWAGIRLDRTRNASNAGTIHADDSPTEIHVIAVDEGRLLARHARELIAASANEVRNP